MTEALNAVIEFGFSTMGLHAVEANIDPRNIGSAKALLKAGFIQEALHREHYYHEGIFKDSAIYRVINRNWN